MVGRTAEAHARIGPLEALTGNGAPPPIQIVDVEPDHEILCKMLIVEPLKDELGAPIPEPGIAIALPYFSEAEFCKEPTTGFVVLPARYEGQQRLSVKIFHDMPAIGDEWLGGCLA